MESRDFADPRYKAWRAAVYRRDRWKCKMPGCKGGDKRLNAHHIKRWASFPTLRYVVANGITLCRTCHGTVRGREDEMETTFMRLVAPENAATAVMLLMMKYGKKEEPS